MQSERERTIVEGMQIHETEQRISKIFQYTVAMRAHIIGTGTCTYCAPIYLYIRIYSSSVPAHKYTCTHAYHT